MGPQEARFTEDNVYDTGITIYGFEDSLINITFIDDPLLNYRYSYELKAGSAALHVRVNEQYVEFSSSGDEPVKAASFNLTLGSSSHYRIGTRGANNSISITYANNASISGQKFQVESAGTTVAVVLRDDVNVESGDLDITLNCDYVYLFIDLPSTMSGRITYGRLPDFNKMTSSPGWGPGPGVSFQTSTLTSPKLDIWALGTQIYAWFG
ncbi:MAG: hypothetical protein P1Q69_12560 [Candidatus Thorarchaeota archaeon]|nr:hypothetical protein [Candidatus Thorarchaeota archaeon]